MDQLQTADLPAATDQYPANACIEPGQCGSLGFATAATGKGSSVMRRSGMCTSRAQACSACHLS